MLDCLITMMIIIIIMVSFKCVSLKAISVYKNNTKGESVPGLKIYANVNKQTKTASLRHCIHT